MSQPFSQFQGDRVYLDTMIFHSLLRTRGPEVDDLFQRIETGQLYAFTSALTFDELAYRMLLSLIRDKYGRSPLDQLRQDREAMIQEFYPRVQPLLRNFKLSPTSQSLKSLRTI